MRNARSPFHGAPTAREMSSRVAVLLGDQHRVPVELRDVGEVDVLAALLGRPDLAGDALGEQVVDRDRVLLAVEVDDQPQDQQGERERRADRRQGLGHAISSLSVSTS